jgi:hypothetical protein
MASSFDLDGATNTRLEHLPRGGSAVSAISLACNRPAPSGRPPLAAGCGGSAPRAHYRRRAAAAVAGTGTGHSALTVYTAAGRRPCAEDAGMLTGPPPIHAGVSRGSPSAHGWSRACWVLPTNPLRLAHGPQGRSRIEHAGAQAGRVPPPSSIGSSALTSACRTSVESLPVARPDPHCRGPHFVAQYGTGWTAGRRDSAFTDSHVSRGDGTPCGMLGPDLRRRSRSGVRLRSESASGSAVSRLLAARVSAANNR